MTFLDHIMLLVSITFLIGALLGFVGGVLVIRNNAEKAKKLDEKYKGAIDSLRK